MVGFLLFCGLNIRSVGIIATVSVFDHFFFFLPFLFLFLLWLLRGFGELVVELSLSIELQTIVNNDHKEYFWFFISTKIIENYDNVCRWWGRCCYSNGTFVDNVDLITIKVIMMAMIIFTIVVMMMMMMIVTILTTLHSWNSCWCQESVSQVLKIGASARLSYFDNIQINPKHPFSIHVCS